MDDIKIIFKEVIGLAAQESVFAELLISGNEQLQMSVSKNNLDKFNSSHSMRAGFRVVSKSSQGYAWTENFSKESLLRTYKEALESAQMLKNNGANIPIPKNAEKSHTMDDLCVEEDIDVEKKIELTKLLESAALAADPRISSVPYNSFADSLSWMRLLNTEGLDKSFKQKYYSGFSYSLAKDGESSKTGYETFFARKFSDIDAQTVGQTAAHRSLKHLGAKTLTTGNYPVVVDSKVAQDLLGSLSNYFSAKSVFEKKSILEGKLGQVVASSKVTLVDDPLNIQCRGVRPFDAEGFNSKKTLLIENGVAKNYLTNLEYAQKMSLPHTASAARSPSSTMDVSASNLIISKGTHSLDDLLKRYPKVVHLTTIAGGLHSGFNGTTGDFSLPGEGFLFEDGENQGPVDQFIFSGNILELMANIEEVGDEYEDDHSSVLVPSLLVKQLSFAGA